MLEFENEKIFDVEINKEMKQSFIEYAMSVIVSRALPDVRDGLKPVHRRILYTMYENKLTYDKAFHKSAATVGDVLGKYHPHGDASVYDALVRLAQPHSLRYPLIEGHGNFGNIDGDPPAAYRYTEARLARLAGEMTKEIERDTVDFVPSFDDRHKEPTVLPSRLPNLLANGAMGIAVGMATNIPTHNIAELIDGAIALIDNPDITTEELMEHVPGPDFPTGGIIVGRAGIREAYNTGRGRIIVRAKTEIVEEKNGKYQIVVTEIPYLVRKKDLVSTIADLHKDKRVEGIADLKDLSGRDGLKIVIDLKHDAVPQVVLNQLFKYSPLQDTFAVNMLALVNGQPKLLTLKSALAHYVDFQKEIVTRRTKFDREKALARLHILNGLVIAIDNIDKVIEIIRTSYDDAKERLMAEFSLSEIQATEILNMRLGRLQGLEKEKLLAEIDELHAAVATYDEILGSEGRLVEVVKEELAEIREKHTDPRRTVISADMSDVEDEDLIEREDCVITRTHAGYVKRMPVDTYRSQRRGGRGITGLTTREEDYVEELFVANTHSYILFFTDRGKVYRLKGYQIPEASRTAKGTNLANLLSIEAGEKVSAVIFTDSFETEGAYITMATKKGTVKRTALSEYDTARRGGLIAILLEDDDAVVSVRITDGRQRVMLATRGGKAIRFEESDIRPMGRPAHGVRGILLEEGDEVITMEVADETAKLVVLTENGFGKRTEFSEYKVQARGGKGVLSYNLTDKTGLVAGMRVAGENDDIIAIAENGVIIRMAANEMPVYGRVTQGVKVMRLDGDAKVVTFAVSPHEDAEEEINE